MSKNDLFLTKARLGGKVHAFDFIPDEEPDDQNSDDSLADAIAELSLAIKEMQSAQVNVDIQPVYEVLGVMQEILVKLSAKRKWKFKVTQDKNGDLSEVDAFEV